MRGIVQESLLSHRQLSSVRDRHEKAGPFQSSLKPVLGRGALVRLVQLYISPRRGGGASVTAFCGPGLGLYNHGLM
jgi:hypothetical protein